ncbi:F510_1955 family glycosylhydrolase [Streptomyces sp. NPDC053427]|uniref:F510_1955 family glycosylhydrolase n=1 Tax=Streptomyces sp. NPDC053427 TaxID=3365701 RepID=UPI0037CED05A
MRKHRTTLAASALLALGLTACSSGAVGSADSRPASSGTAISHIHGLGIDPDSERLYVATHEGIFTPDRSGEPQRVGDSEDDFMGFTVAGAKTFLASGHPAPGGDGPGNRGLLRSSDAGRSWTSESLAGEADFHALDQVHGTVYGYDSTNGVLRVSKDGVRWESRAELQAFDIAVNPADADVVLATTPDGVAKSTDGGRTFADGGQPALAFVSWAAKGALYGIDATGGLRRSLDGGTTWKETAAVPGGRPQALTAVDARHVLAATEGGVYESKDGGKTFRKRLAAGSSGGH